MGYQADKNFACAKEEFWLAMKAKKEKKVFNRTDFNIGDFYFN